MFTSVCFALKDKKAQNHIHECPSMYIQWLYIQWLHIQQTNNGCPACCNQIGDQYQEIASHKKNNQYMALARDEMIQNSGFQFDFD